MLHLALSQRKSVAVLYPLIWLELHTLGEVILHWEDLWQLGIVEADEGRIINAPLQHVVFSHNHIHLADGVDQLGFQLHDKSVFFALAHRALRCVSWRFLCCLDGPHEIELLLAIVSVISIVVAIVVWAH